MDSVIKLKKHTKKVPPVNYMGQLYTERANLIKQASEFKGLGVSVQKELPAELIEKENLELGEEQIKLSPIDKV